MEGKDRPQRLGFAEWCQVVGVSDDYWDPEDPPEGPGHAKNPEEGWDRGTRSNQPTPELEERDMREGPEGEGAREDYDGAGARQRWVKGWGSIWRESSGD